VPHAQALGDIGRVPRKLTAQDGFGQLMKNGKFTVSYALPCHLGNTGIYVE